MATNYPLLAAIDVVGEIVTTDGGVQFAITTGCVALALSVKEPTARMDGILGTPRKIKSYSLVPP
jgi:hypothetical protein